MNTQGVILNTLLAALVAGCATAPPPCPPLPMAATRINLDRVALVSLASTPEFDLQIPSTKQEAAGEAATKLGLGWLEGLPTMGGGGPGDGLALAVCLMWTPVGLALGSAYGGLTGEHEDQLRSHASTVGEVAASLRFEEELRDTLLAVAEQKAGCKLAAHDPPSAPTASSPPSWRPPGTGFASGQNLRATQTAYLPLGQEGFKTVLEIKSYHPGLLGREGLNPHLAVSVDVCVRLVDAESGRELYYDYLQYRGPKRRFAEWAVNGAKPLRDELESCCRKLSEEIVAQAFVRPETTRGDAVALAQSGIRRK